MVRSASSFHAAAVDPSYLRALFTQGIPVAPGPDAARSPGLQCGLRRGRPWISHLSRRGMFYGGYHYDDTVSIRAAARHLCAILPWLFARSPHSSFLLSAGHEAGVFSTARGVTSDTINSHILERDDNGAVRIATSCLRLGDRHDGRGERNMELNSSERPHRRPSQLKVHLLTGWLRTTHQDGDQRVVQDLSWPVSVNGHALRLARGR